MTPAIEKFGLITTMKQSTESLSKTGLSGARAKAKRIRLAVWLALPLAGAVVYWASWNSQPDAKSGSQAIGDAMAGTTRSRPDSGSATAPAEWDLVGRVKAARTKEDRKVLLARFLHPNSPEFSAGDGVDRLFTAWFANDPGGALDAIDLIGADARGYQMIRLTALSCGLEAFAANPALIDSKAAQCFTSTDYEDNLDEFRRRLYPVLGTSNPVAGVKLLEATNPKYKVHLFKDMCETWVQKDPRAAAKEMARFDHPKPAQMADWACMLHYAELKVADVQWARSEKLPSEILDKIASVATKSTIRDLGTKGYLKQLEAAGSMSGIARPILEAATEMDPGGFVENLEGFEKAGIFNRDRDAALAMRKIYGADSLSALNFFELLSSTPREQAKAAAALSEAMIWRDANTCSRWLSSLPSGPVRDAALGPMLAYLKDHNETKAIAQWKALKSKQ